ncbi:MAG: metal ABC transporter solute-binding protein, Zn/Mn family [Desulfovibrionaceae bacterium]
MAIILFIFVFSPNAYAKKLSVVVSIPPQKYFVNKIAKDHVTVEILVPQGADPHTFEPRPKQLQFLRSADIYFSIGIGSENKWLTYAKEFSPSLHIVPSYSEVNINKNNNTKLSANLVLSKKSASHKHENIHGGNHSHQGDQHTWLSPKHVIVIVERMRDVLVEYDRKNATFYEKNAADFIEEIRILDASIVQSLSGKKHRAFLSYHQAWDYFAEEYNLQEIAVENVGKETTAKDIARIIEKAKAQKVTIAIAQPQHGMKILELIARTLSISVRSVDPLSENWTSTMKEMQNILVKFLQ